jgi:hypothetical protein
MPHFRQKPHFFDEVLALHSMFRVQAGKNALTQSAVVVKRCGAHRGLKTGVHRF